MPDADGFPTLEEQRARSPAGRAMVARGEDPTKPTPSVAVPPGEWLVDPNNPAATVMREGLIGLNQLGVGVAGDAATAGRWAWNTARTFRPSIGEPPPIFNPQGEGGYINQLTPTGLTPYTPGERIWAAGAQNAGSALPFLNWKRAAFSGLAGAGAQAVREYGDPAWSEPAAEDINYVGGLAQFPGAFSSDAAPFALARTAGMVPSWMNAPAAAPAAAPAPGNITREGAAILGVIGGEELSRHMGATYGWPAGVATAAGLGLGAYTLRNMGMMRGGPPPTWSGAAQVGARLLGGFFMANTMSGQGYPRSRDQVQPLPPFMSYTWQQPGTETGEPTAPSGEPAPTPEAPQPSQ